MDFKVDEICSIENIPELQRNDDFKTLWKCVFDFDIEEFAQLCNYISNTIIDPRMFQMNMEAYGNLVKIINTKITAMTFSQISIMPILDILENTHLNLNLVKAVDTPNVIFALKFILALIKSNHEFSVLFIEYKDKLIDFYLNVSDLEASVISFEIIFWLFNSLDSFDIHNFDKIMAKAVSIEISQENLYKMMKMCLEKSTGPANYLNEILSSLDDTYDSLKLINIKNILFQIIKIASDSSFVYEAAIFKKILREIFNSDANISHQIMQFISEVSYDPMSHHILNETIPYNTLIELANTENEIDNVVFFKYIINMFEYYKEDICNDDIIDALFLGALLDSGAELKETALLFAKSLFTTDHFSGEFADAVFTASVDWLSGIPSATNFTVILSFIGELLNYSLVSELFPLHYFEDIGLLEVIDELSKELEDSESEEIVSSIIKMIDHNN